MSSETPTSSTQENVWLRPLVLGIVVPAIVLMAAYCWHLWPEWSRNPDLSHGFFTPVICVLLILESRRSGTQRWLPSNSLGSWLPLLAMGASVVLFALSGLLAASVGWDNVLVDFFLGATLAAALLAGLLCLASRPVSLVPFNWISLTAAGLWILSSPLPSGTYARITAELQSWVSSGVINVLQLLGIPARQHGNIIELTRTTVGVEEACSGIRSLLSCTYASFFFAAWQVRTPLGRLALILLAPVLALGMNFVRSLSLTLMANAGVEISGFWHDVTGFSILTLTAAILALLAMKLGKPAVEPREVPQVQSARADTPGWGPRFFSLGVGVLSALAAIFAFYGRPVPLPAKIAPDPALLLPSTADGWEVTSANDIYKFAGILRTTQLVERTYAKIVDGQPLRFSIYVAHWSPGQAPVSLVASHTPDACWPGAGWFPQPNVAPEPTLALPGRTLPPAEHRIFKSDGYAPQQVWFWHVYDGRVISYRDPYSVPALLELALRYGFRREGEQYFIRITSNQPWNRLAQEPLLQQIVTQLTGVGLTP